jgi:hypothetical protein
MQSESNCHAQEVQSADEPGNGAVVQVVDQQRLRKLRVPQVKNYAYGLKNAQSNDHANAQSFCKILSLVLHLIVNFESESSALECVV